MVHPTHAAVPACRPCLACGAASAYHCERCKLATYCSAACQTAHWSRPNGAGHRATCAPVPGSGADAAIAGSVVGSPAPGRPVAHDAAALARAYCTAGRRDRGAIGDEYDDPTAATETQQQVARFETDLKKTVTWMNGVVSTLTAHDLLQALARPSEGAEKDASRPMAAVGRELDQIVGAWSTFTNGLRSGRVRPQAAAEAAVTLDPVDDQLSATTFSRALCGAQSLFARLFALMTRLGGALTGRGDGRTADAGVFSYLAGGLRAAWAYVTPVLEAAGQLLQQCIRLVGTAIPDAVRALFRRLVEQGGYFLRALVAKYQSAASVVVALVDGLVAQFRGSSNADLRARVTRLGVYAFARINMARTVLMQLTPGQMADGMRYVARAAVDLLRRVGGEDGWIRELYAHFDTQRWFRPVMRVAGIALAGGAVVLGALLNLAASVLDASLRDSQGAALAMITRMTVQKVASLAFSYGMHALYSAVVAPRTRTTETRRRAETASDILETWYGLAGGRSPASPDRDPVRAQRVLRNLRDFYAFAARNGGIVAADATSVAATERAAGHIDVLLKRLAQTRATPPEFRTRDPAVDADEVERDLGARLWRTSGHLTRLLEAATQSAEDDTDDEERTRMAERILADPDVRALFARTCGHADPSDYVAELAVLHYDVSRAITAGYVATYAYFVDAAPEIFGLDADDRAPQVRAQLHALHQSLSVGGLFDTDSDTETETDEEEKTPDTAATLLRKLRMGELRQKNDIENALTVITQLQNRLDTQLLNDGNVTRQRALGLRLPEGTDPAVRRYEAGRLLDELRREAVNMRRLLQHAVPELREVRRLDERARRSQAWLSTRWVVLLGVLVIVVVGLGFYMAYEATMQATRVQTEAVYARSASDAGQALSPQQRSVMHWMHRAVDQNATSVHLDHAELTVDELLPGQVSRPPAGEQPLDADPASLPERAYQVAVRATANTVDYVSNVRVLPETPPPKPILGREGYGELLPLDDKAQFTRGLRTVLDRGIEACQTRTATYEQIASDPALQEKVTTETYDAIVRHMDELAGTDGLLGTDVDLTGVAAEAQARLDRNAQARDAAWFDATRPPPVELSPLERLALQRRWFNDFAPRYAAARAAATSEGLAQQYADAYRGQPLVDVSSAPGAPAVATIDPSDGLSSDERDAVLRQLGREVLQRSADAHVQARALLEQIRSDSSVNRLFSIYNSVASEREAGDLDAIWSSFAPNFDKVATFWDFPTEIVGKLLNVPAMLRYASAWLYATLISPWARHFTDPNEAFNAVLQRTLRALARSNVPLLTSLSVLIPWISMTFQAWRLSPASVSALRLVTEPLVASLVGILGYGFLSWFTESSLVGKIIVIGGGAAFSSSTVLWHLRTLMTLVGTFWLGPVSGSTQIVRALRSAATSALDPEQRAQFTAMLPAPGEDQSTLTMGRAAPVALQLPETSSALVRDMHKYLADPDRSDRERQKFVKTIVELVEGDDSAVQ